jgi:hypothetical protein
MKFLIIGLTSVFLFSCGQNGELTNTKEDFNTMKLSKESKHIKHGHMNHKYIDNSNIDNGHINHKYIDNSNIDNGHMNHKHIDNSNTNHSSNYKEYNNSGSQALDAKTTKIYTDTKTTAPRFDTGLRPSNSK